jgi:hypothetical protein
VPFDLTAADVVRAIAAIGGSVAAIFAYLNRRGQRIETNGNIAADRKRSRRIQRGKPNIGDAVWMLQRQLEEVMTDSRAHYAPLIERMDQQHSLILKENEAHDEMLREVRRIVKRVEGTQEVQEQRAEAEE